MDYPDIAIQMDELVENLHRNELTPAEKSAHQTLYAGLLKKAHKVQGARNKQGKTQAKNPKDGRLESHPVTLGPNGTLPTVSEKLAADTGVERQTVHRRHQQALALTARCQTVTDKLARQLRNGSILEVVCY